MRKGRKHTPESIAKLIAARGGGPVPRFWKMINKSTLSGCWEWMGGLNETGHPRFWVDRKLVGAHRFSYELHNGPIEVGLVVMHDCDNPRCVRPDHLSVGTNQDNSNDAVFKGRVGKFAGKRLDQRTKELIHALHLAGMTRIAISRELNVAPKTVQKYARKSA